MDAFPHVYVATVSASEIGQVALRSADLPEIATAPPAEFGGPGDRWSPETLLVGAVVDCFALTFRALAAASKLDWIDLDCTASGTLEKTEGGLRFTGIHLDAHLRVPAGSDDARAARLLERSEQQCLISNSLACPVTLDAHVEA